MFKAYVPGGVVALVVTVRADDAGTEAFTGLGLKAAAAPDGRPLTDRVTGAENPPVGVTDTP